MKISLRYFNSQDGSFKAFTLTEILAAALLSAILLAFVVTIFSFFMERIRSESSIMEKMEEVYILKTCLDDKMIRCDSLNIEDGRIKFFETGEVDSFFEFANRMIIFNNKEVSDTFNLSHNEMSYTYLSDIFKLISRINFTIDMGSFNLPVMLSKDYEGEIMVNSKIVENEN